MREHIVIRREEFVGGTREKPEIGVFTQTRTNCPPVPWKEGRPRCECGGEKTCYGCCR